MDELKAWNISSLPKVELHLHLDCSLSYAVVSKINPAVTQEEYLRNFIAPAKCINLADYISRAEQGVTLMQTEQDLRFVTADLFEQLLCDKVLYAEMRFAPLLHTQKGLTPEEVVEIVDDAVEQGSKNSGIEARLILCTLRHFSAEQSMQTVQLVERFRGRRVVALDIAGDEAGFPVDAHIAAFQYAIANNIPRTAHAGEARGAESVWETLKHFRPTRIGHGVRTIEDKQLMEYLKQARVHLELCPTSNVQITTLNSYHEHPIAALYDAGISVGVNTDARTISNVTLAHEYEVLQRVFGWGAKHFKICNLNALEAAFIPETVKEHLVGHLMDGYADL